MKQLRWDYLLIAVLLTTMAQRRHHTQEATTFIGHLRKVYKSLYENINPIPYITEDVQEIDQLFVEGRVQKLTGSSQENRWIDLKSYKEIFEEDQNATLFVIEGDPGYGKSITSLKLAQDWVKGNEDSFVGKVDILIILRVRQMRNVHSLPRAIHRFLLPPNSQFDHDKIRAILQDHTYVVFFDGYDEYPDYIKRRDDLMAIIIEQMNSKCTIVLSSRIVPEYIQNAQRFRLRGFDRVIHEEFIQSFSCRNRNVDIDQIKKNIRENEVLEAICEVPLFFVAVIYLSARNREILLSKSVTEVFDFMVQSLYAHFRNKTRDDQSQKYTIEFESKHVGLNKIAFEKLLTGKTLYAEETEKELGSDCYEYFTRVGVLVESIHEAERLVQFMSTLLCEWYAAHTVVQLALSNDIQERERIKALDPNTHKFVHRFACGISPRAAASILVILESMKSRQKLLTLCILEKRDGAAGIIGHLEKLCSKPIEIEEDDSLIQQQSIKHLLVIASKKKISVASLHLSGSFDDVGVNGDSGYLKLRSGICLSALETVKKIQITTRSGHHLSNEDALRKFDALPWHVSSEIKVYNSLSPDNRPTVGSVPFPEEISMKRNKTGIRGLSVDIETTATMRNKEEEFNRFLSVVGLDNRLLTPLSTVDAMTITIPAVTHTIVHDFFRKLAAYDTRVQKITAMGSTNSSTRDIIYAILKCSDIFLQQNIISKLASCQLAVPILLPSFKNKGCTFLAWGLRKVAKSWWDLSQNAIREENVTGIYFPTVTVLRIGDVDISKSDVLNKLLGSVQGNDDHPHFNTHEMDPGQREWSTGSVECTWLLPNDDREKTTTKRINNAVRFLNLRGDASLFQNQASFAIDNAVITVVFVASKHVKRFNRYIDHIVDKSHVILITVEPGCHHGMIETQSKTETKTIFKTGNTMNLMLGEHISARIQEIVGTKEAGMVNEAKTCPHESQITLCESLGIEVDEKSAHCIEGMNAARDIASATKKTLLRVMETNSALPSKSVARGNAKLTTDQQLKESLFPLQSNSKKSGKVCKTHRYTELCLSQPMLKFLESLSMKGDNLHICLEFSQILLDELCKTRMKPLTQELSDEVSKDLHWENQVERKHHVKVMKEVIKKIDEYSIGYEHFMREIGLFFESAMSAGNSEQVEHLPGIAAELVMHGYPVEIMGGDSGHIPLKWIQAILKSISQKHQESNVCVLSIIGPRNSGKSTLLNSMFGARFAVSGKRSSKGVFLHFIQIDSTIREDGNGCDFLIIVDTEGIGTTHKKTPGRDCQLATLALCISTSTLVNIGELNIREVIDNALQIPSRALIRMKEFNCSVQCRIVAQFVANVNNNEGNHYLSTNQIAILDDAVRRAAKHENTGDKYTTFRDLVSFQTTDILSYHRIPYLWRGFMDPPDYRYSGSIQELRRSILQQGMETIRFQDFSNRIADVSTHIHQMEQTGLPVGVE